MPENPQGDDTFADLFSKLPSPRTSQPASDAAPTPAAPDAPLSRRAARFQAASGTRPGRSKSRLISVLRPKPQARAISCTASGPQARAEWNR